MRNTILNVGHASDPDNEVKIADDSVSRKHLRVEWLNDQEMIIEDVGSRNGTFVNGQEVVRKKITPRDKLIIGRSHYEGTEFFNIVRRVVRKSEVAFYNEFAALEQEFSAFHKQLRKLQVGYSIKVNLVRVAVVVLFFALFISFGKELGVPDEARMLIFVVGGGASALLSEKLFSKTDMEMSRRLLTERYQDILACPKCGHKLINQSYEYWKNKRKCPACQANWVA